jgi:hypothetical protein
VAAKECRIVTLSNKSAELGVCPEHGRIVIFKLRQGHNVLWRNSGKLEAAILKGWKNYGGDKVWLIPQNMRPSAFANRLPDPYIDGKPWRVIEQSKNSVTIQSRLSKALGCIIARKITLDPVKPITTIDNRVIQKKKTPFTVHIWQVSQVVKPEYAVIGLDNRIFPGRKPYFRHRGQKSGSKITGTADYIKIVLPEKEWDKINAWGQWLAAAYPECIFIQAIKLENNQPYPENSSVQVYGNADYVEMETLSPLVHLQPGGTYCNRVVWGLLATEKNKVVNKIRDFVKSELETRIK